MSLGEFDLIKKYFNRSATQREDVALGIGDDCALLKIPPGHQLAVTTDTLVCGTHFVAHAPPHAIGHKSLAANISDLAAMGATPTWISLALTLPQVDESWIKGFCEGLFELATRHNMQLIGGDTTSGPLSLTISVCGTLPIDSALTRSGAQQGDFIYVTGDLGDSKAGLDLILQPPQLCTPLQEALIHKHYYPQPNTDFARALLPHANSAIDISDGLISDLGHILKASNRGADIWAGELPLSQYLTRYQHDAHSQIEYALTSGEEYELCFTSAAPPELLYALAREQQQKITRIGRINTQPNSMHIWEDEVQDKAMHFNTLQGYDHFS